MISRLLPPARRDALEAGRRRRRRRSSYGYEDADVMHADLGLGDGMRLVPEADV